MNPKEIKLLIREYINEVYEGLPAKYIANRWDDEIPLLAQDIVDLLDAGRSEEYLFDMLHCWLQECYDEDLLYIHDLREISIMEMAASRAHEAEPSNLPLSS